MPPSRNVLEKSGFVLSPLDSYSRLSGFDCGDDDLNDYFNNDAVKHKLQLMTLTYILTASFDPNRTILAVVDLCNDAIRKNIGEKALKELPEEKRYPAIPAVKITRLGVRRHLRNMGIGTAVIDMLKELFLHDNRTGCRFITVDAYNKDSVTSFYLRNHFDFMNDKDAEKHNRAMYLDLLRFNN